MQAGSAIFRILQAGVRALQLCCAFIIGGIFIYILNIEVSGLFGGPDLALAVISVCTAVVVYAGAGIILTLCLGGYIINSVFAIFLDVCFMGCFAAIAHFSRTADPPIGDDYDEALPVISFTTAIVAIFLFLGALLQTLIVCRHKRNKRYSPSLANNDTSAEGRKAHWKKLLSQGKATKYGREANHHNNSPSDDFMNLAQMGVRAEPTHGKQQGSIHDQSYSHSGQYICYTPLY